MSDVFLHSSIKKQFKFKKIRIGMRESILYNVKFKKEISIHVCFTKPILTNLDLMLITNLFWKTVKSLI